MCLVFICARFPYHIFSPFKCVIHPRKATSHKECELLKIIWNARETSLSQKLCHRCYNSFKLYVEAGLDRLNVVTDVCAQLGSHVPVKVWLVNMQLQLVLWQCEEHVNVPILHKDYRTYLFNTTDGCLKYWPINTKAIGSEPNLTWPQVSGWKGSKLQVNKGECVPRLRNVNSVAEQVLCVKGKGTTQIIHIGSTSFVLRN